VEEHCQKPTGLALLSITVLRFSIHIPPVDVSKEPHTQLR